METDKYLHSFDQSPDAPGLTGKTAIPFNCNQGFAEASG